MRLLHNSRETFDGLLVTTPHQTFMKWFNHDSAFKYFNTMDSTTVATVVFAFDEKNIENTYNGTGFVIARTSHTDITACTWTTKSGRLLHQKVKYYYVRM